jgi:hypothetical protein
MKIKPFILKKIPLFIKTFGINIFFVIKVIFNNYKITKIKLKILLTLLKILFFNIKILNNLLHLMKTLKCLSLFINPETKSKILTHNIITHLMNQEKLEYFLLIQIVRSKIIFIINIHTNEINL